MWHHWILDWFIFDHQIIHTLFYLHLFFINWWVKSLQYFSVWILTGSDCSVMSGICVYSWYTAESGTVVILCGISSQCERLGFLEQSDEHQFQWCDLCKSYNPSVLILCAAPLHYYSALMFLYWFVPSVLRCCWLAITKDIPPVRSKLLRNYRKFNFWELD